MAKTSYNPLSQWRGRVGGLIYKVVNGKQVVMPYSAQKKSTHSEAQLMTQAKFTLAGKLSSIIPAPVLYGLGGSKTNRRSEFMSNVVKKANVVATATGYTAGLDAPDVIFSKGDVIVNSSNLVLSNGVLNGTVSFNDASIKGVMVIGVLYDANKGEYTQCQYGVFSTAENSGSYVANASIDFGVLTGLTLQVYIVPMRVTTEGQNFMANSGLELGTGDDEYVLNVLLSSVESAFQYCKSQYVGFREQV